MVTFNLIWIWFYVWSDTTYNLSRILTAVLPTFVNGTTWAAQTADTAENGRKNQQNYKNRNKENQSEKCKKPLKIKIVNENQKNLY